MSRLKALRQKQLNGIPSVLFIDYRFLGKLPGSLAMSDKVKLETEPLNFEYRDAASVAEHAEDFRNSMLARRTVRDFSSKPVPREIIETCLLSAGNAPSGANQQPWHFVAISDSDIKSKIREAAEEEERAFYAGRAGEEWLDALAHLGTDDHKPFLEEAPWLIAIFAKRWGEDDEGKKIKHYYVPESVGIASGFFVNGTASSRVGQPHPYTSAHEVFN